MRLDPAADAPDARRRKASAWWLVVALLGLVALAYWPGRGGGFVFDDQQNIVRNLPLHVTSLDWRQWMAAAFSSPASTIQRPLAMLTFAVNHYFTGLDPVPMKLTNVAIHLLNTLLVLGLVRSLLALPVLARAIDTRRREWAALFATAAWALHPINLMAVLYVVQRMESLSHTFVFAGLWLYLLGRQRQQAGGNGWGWIVGGLVLGSGLGLLAKESAALLPLYAFCIELCLLDFRVLPVRRERKLFALYAVLLFVPAVLGLAWLWPQVSDAGAFSTRHFSLGERLLTEPRVVLDYLRWILWPDLGALGLNHDDYVVSRGLLEPPSTLLAMVAVAALLGLAVWCRRRRPLVALGLLWFLGAQLLTATILPLELAYEHRNYFASLGICLAAADLLLLAPGGGPRQRIGILLAIVGVGVLGGLTFLRAHEWSTPTRFYLSEAAKRPDSPRASFELARTLVGLTRYDAGSPLLPEAWRALEAARRVPRSSILPHQAALILAAHTGTLDQRGDWWRDMQQRLREQPLDAENLTALISLGDCAANQRCRFPPGAMVATFAAALQQGPHPVVLSAYGKYALHVLGDTGLALRLWRDASAFDPGDVQFRYNLARLLVELGRYDEARAEIAELRRRDRMWKNEAMATELEARIRNAEPVSGDAGGIRAGQDDR